MANEALTSVLSELAKRRAVSASEATPTIEYKAPTTTLTPQASMAGATSSMSLIDNKIKDYEAERNALDTTLTAEGATGTTFYDKLTSLISKKPQVDTSGVLSQQQAKYGIDSKLSELQAQNTKVAGIQGDIKKLETEELAGIDTAEGRVASRGAIEGEKETITRKYNIAKAYKYAELYAESAVASAMSGNLSEARNLVQDAVNAYTYDIEQEISRFDNLFSVASSWVQNLDAKEQSLLTAKRDELQAQADQVKADKTQIGELMITYNGAGIRLTDTLEQALAKANIYAQAHPEVAQTLGSAETGYTMYDRFGNIIGSKAGSGTGSGSAIAQNFAGFMTDAINNGATPEAAAQTAIAYAKELGLEIKPSQLTEFNTLAKQLSTEITNTKIAKEEEEKKSKTPYVPANQGAYNAGKLVKTKLEQIGEDWETAWNETIGKTASSFFAGWGE